MNTTDTANADYLKWGKNNKAPAMLLDAVAEFLKSLPPHLRRLWRPDIGTQILYQNGDAKRIPFGGNSKNPHFDDTPYYLALTPRSVLGVGVNGWNWVDQVSEYVTYDLDSIVNHAGGVPAEKLAEIVEQLKTIDCEIVRSKSGHGYHVRVHFDPFPVALTHTAHAKNAKRVLAWLGDRLKLPMNDAVDVAGGIAWIWHANTAPNGFEVVKELAIKEVLS